MKFYKCPICGNVITVIDGNIANLKCCTKNLEELKANTVDASFEKHVPVYKIEGNQVQVTIGEVSHPMTDDHYITFIAQVIDNQCIIHQLKPTDEPKAIFDYVKGSKIYAYCNLHGLWVKEID